MKIATYNVRVDTDYDGSWQWSFRKDYVINLIRYHDWDLFGVQEVRPNQLKDLCQLSGYDCISAERDGDGYGEGVAVFFKKNQFQLIDHGFFWLSETPDVPSIHPEAGYARVAVWLLVKEIARNQEILVINTHLDNISESARTIGMKVILKQLEQKILEYPTILMGDLNAWPEERVHTEIQKWLINGKKINQGYHYGPDITFQNFNYNFLWATAEEIDYIYLKDFSVTGTAVLTDSCDQRFPSDHFPLEMIIK
ncbi:endonuclease/exonuclease/phosphatase family protein [Enterococcus songbeiensis]|uniref:endonuclease/exonuclease/phosphatase family protein n=1 Tax=Enterococcus songbeiensis TaxID=2559927 RepID=UPI0010F5FD33|nr:endonuclease/exonuclease/phosphatase family protein [Enterococcus songbeiensis]